MAWRPEIFLAVRRFGAAPFDQCRKFFFIGLRREITMLYVLIPLAVIAALLLYATTRPDAFRLERSTVIAAPPDKVFALIDDFHEWTKWSPWENIDPALRRSYSGSENGRGTIYAWEGNSKVGSGRMETTESVAASKIVIKLDFFKPFEAHNIAEFTLTPKDGGTAVNWAMYGPNPYMAKLMQIFFSMDKMVGGQFEQGLAKLKAAAEK
jgi:uncharacterized protein YndB with AHSA1/START domain